MLDKYWNTITIFLCVTSLTMHVGNGAQEDGLRHVEGAGASFPAAVYKVWIPQYKAYRRDHVKIHMSYEAVGSGAGKARMMGRGVNTPVIHYAGSDSMMTEEEYMTYPDLQMIPVIAGAIVIVHNIPGINELKLSTQNLVDIFDGTVRFWNHPSIASNNQNITLANKRIHVVVRADKSGTTEAFTSALSAFSDKWLTEIGTFSDGIDDNDVPYHWNASAISLYGRTSRGVAGLVLSQRYSIGYLSASAAQEAKIKYASLINRAGNTVRATVENVQHAMDDYVQFLDSRLTVSLVDAPGERSYPIAVYSYFIVKMTGMTECEAAIEFVRYVTWFLKEPQPREECINLNMVPLGRKMVSVVIDNVLKRMHCLGELIYPQMLAIKAIEDYVEPAWFMPVVVAVPFVVIILLLIILNLARPQLRVLRAIIKRDWVINKDEIQFQAHVPKKGITSRIAMSRNKIQPSMTSCVSMSSTGHPALPSAHGYWKDIAISLHQSSLENLEMNMQTRRTMVRMRELVRNDNVTRFYGLTQMETQVFAVYESCPKSSLKTVLQKRKYNLDNNFKFCMAYDIVSGMAYLHNLDIVHGSLKAASCYLDSKWVVKLNLWTNLKLATSQRIPWPPATTADAYEKSKHWAWDEFWRAPELLRSDVPCQETKASDVYSFSILMQEIFTREDPYSELATMKTPEEIIIHIKSEALRPQFTAACPSNVRLIMMKSWVVDPFDRPLFAHLQRMLRDANPSRKTVMDCMFDSLEEYVTNLEDKVEERTFELTSTVQNMEKLLKRALPPSVAESLTHGLTVETQKHEHTAVLHIELVGFGQMVQLLQPVNAVDLLGELHDSIDDVIEKYGQSKAFKLDSLSDSVIIVSGITEDDSKVIPSESYVGYTATIGLTYLSAVKEIQQTSKSAQHLQLKMGIHSGPLVAGFVGKTTQRYSLVGGTIQTAFKLAQTSYPMKIQISDQVHQHLSTSDKYQLLFRGDMTIEASIDANTSDLWMELS